jgi:hypothetical protein
MILVLCGLCSLSSSIRSLDDAGRKLLYRGLNLDLTGHYLVGLDRVAAKLISCTNFKPGLVRSQLHVNRLGRTVQARCLPPLPRLRIDGSGRDNY